MAERKLAIITGASSGIGAMFARKLAARGYNLLLVARREDRLRSLAVELAETYHVSAGILVADLAVDAERERVAERIGSAPDLGLLVNNAGFGTLGFFADSDVESQLQMHRLHVIAALHLTHAALANLIPRGEGGVINVSSVAAFGQSAGSVSYCATKGWMNDFTAGLYAGGAEIPRQDASAVPWIHFVGVSRHGAHRPESDPAKLVDDHGFRGE